MKVRAILVAIVIAWGFGCVSDKSSLTPASALTVAIPSGLTQQDFIFAVLGYLDRWQMDSAMWERLSNTGQIEVRVRMLEVKTDPGDRSQFAELWLPGAGLLVDLKQADHFVPERKLALKDDGFKVRAVHRANAADLPDAGWTVLRLSIREVATRLSQIRTERLFPDSDLEMRMQAALAGYLREHHEREMAGGAQTLHLAPIFPVCNEVWIYWENRRTALRIAADGDLANPRIWEQLPLHLREVSLEEKAVAMPGATTGGGKFITHEWAGRLLYNCVVLGRTFTLPSALRQTAP